MNIRLRKVAWVFSASQAFLLLCAGVGFLADNPEWSKITVTVIHPVKAVKLNPVSAPSQKKKKREQKRRLKEMGYISVLDEYEEGYIVLDVDEKGDVFFPQWELGFVEQEEGAPLLYIDYFQQDFHYIDLKVPRFFIKMDHDRVLQEMEQYRYLGNQWSERVLLELMYYTLTYGNDLGVPADEEKSRDPIGLEQADGWLNDVLDICYWEGIGCLDTRPPTRYGEEGYRAEEHLGGDASWMLAEVTEWGYDTRRTPARPIYDPTSAPTWETQMFDHTYNFHHRVTKIDLPGRRLEGTLPSELAGLKVLYRLNLYDNYLEGTIPTEYGTFSSLGFLDLSDNILEGGIPSELALLNRTLEELWLSDNKFYHLPSELGQLTQCGVLGLNGNELTGIIPSELGHMSELMAIFLTTNALNGTIPTDLFRTEKLLFFDLGGNYLSGTIPTEVAQTSGLLHFHVDENHLTGTIPTHLFHLRLVQQLRLNTNKFFGTIPVGTNVHTSSAHDDATQGWANLSELRLLLLGSNQLSGTISPRFCMELASVGMLNHLFLGNNRLKGKLPTEFGLLWRLNVLDVSHNGLSGTIPYELIDMGKYEPIIGKINLTSNHFLGTVPQEFCDAKIWDDMDRKDYGCDAILCPPGTYHPSGAADEEGGCRDCPDYETAARLFLGRQTCPMDDSPFVHGDVDADGYLTAREILRLVYVRTVGTNWGAAFDTWNDMDVHECDLVGVQCVGLDVAKIDLSDADMCTDHDYQVAKENTCMGIPAEIGMLSTLEVLSLSRRRYMRGTIPTEIGRLTRLRYLDWFGGHMTSGATIPSEIGNLKGMQVLNLSNSRIEGTLPTELFKLRVLEKLNLGSLYINGTIPSEIGLLTNVREIIISRTNIEGALPTEITNCKNLENLEIYGNKLNGEIPTRMGDLTNMKRFDAFNNEFYGSLPSSLGDIETLQILHLKKNYLSGTIPKTLGKLKHITWIDLSSNILSGTIPASLGHIASLKDLRLANNQLHSPIPHSLCTNTKVNNGRAAELGCAAILCPVGYYHEQGFATSEEACKLCEGMSSTLFLGGTECIPMHLEDILVVYHAVMNGIEYWDDASQRNWGNFEADVCEWGGIECDEESGVPIAINIPLNRESRFYSKHDTIGYPLFY